MLADDNLYCTLYETAPETAVQLTVALLEVILDEAKPLGVPHETPEGGVQPSEVVKETREPPAANKACIRFF